ncbi:FAD-dependent oxidoreductase [Arthrobacter sp. zg-Y820]|uniref:NAD(P)/FAD-dependent oxidoreductase n=1 Tax=unclassified Arthrobacter TaxID=235627 RepID=UPI001E48B527|nr:MULTISPECIES: FAD-dependent oxidoreductase [unclassified Arthrobacter]MCC9195418.1 FAD-binding oxidoreductase [Arthrobacter sp. zg-Y820]MDK1278277.1 FAD-dependent oxidoreductase [Arthrobacter sp. zg.Y820]WIB10157.1 FAD-dependent oxidoreductase [Arthrobacter sp. zg-Y820]
MPTVYDLAERRHPPHRVAGALAGAAALPYWLDDPDRPAELPALQAGTDTDLAVVGGGYTGLWTALMAKERDPGRRVLLLEGRRIGWAASGRNGGFCEASLTHGKANGEKHLPGEAHRLEQLGRENLHELAETVKRYGIDCGFEWTGSLSVATEAHQVAELAEEAADDPGLVFLDGEAVRKEVDSPLYLAGLWDRESTALLNPARLAWGLARACREAGVVICENTPVRALHPDGNRIRLTTDGGTVTARHAALGTNAFPSLLRRTRLHTVPVYDYALMTEPLSDGQLAAVGWHNRQGLSDLNNRFHYYRLTTDASGRPRILFGGYDAVYHYGRTLRPDYDQRRETFDRLAAHFRATFPQLDGLAFSHAWGGAVDTCSRFFPFFETAHQSAVAYTAGFTGLGVGATRFAANVLLDLLSGTQTERTRLEMVRKKPLPFPPEPAAWLGIKATTAAMVRADRRQGRRGPWLKALDYAGMGFDS